MNTINNERPLINQLLPALFSAGLILGLESARADIFRVTITDATFSTPCAGGVGTCSETINGFFMYNDATFSASSVSLKLSGSLTTSLGAYGGTGIGSSLVYLNFYDNSVSDFTPINFDLALPARLAPGSSPLDPASFLWVPSLCGGLPNCDAFGTFPHGTYSPVSGTATLVPVPEPSALNLLIAGIAAAGFIMKQKLKMRHGEMKVGTTSASSPSFRKQDEVRDEVERGPT